MDDIRLDKQGAVAILALCRPPENFVDEQAITMLADALEALDADASVRAVILASEGKHFCAGANLAKRAREGGDRGHIYGQAARLTRTRKPLIAAIQGAAIGAGLGLAMVADFRVGCAEARFSANFNRQGYSPGFGLTFLLPNVVGKQAANWMFYSGERVKGEDALRIGLIDRLMPLAELREAAMNMATEIALSGPLAVQETRALARGDFAARFDAAVQAEMALQDRLRLTADYREGVAAMSERRVPVFRGE